MKAAVCANDEAALCLVLMSPDNNDKALNNTGDNGGDSCADNTHSGHAELAVNENVVQAEVYENCGDTCLHGQHGLAGLLKGACIALADSKGQQTEEHYGEVLAAVSKGGGKVKSFFAFVEEEVYKLRAKEYESQHKQCRNRNRYDYLDAEGVAYTFLVALTVILGGEDTCTGNSTEDAKVEDEQQLVDYSNAGHGLGAQAANHDVVYKADKVGDNVLNEYRDSYGHYLLVKCLVADEFFQYHKTLL